MIKRGINRSVLAFALTAGALAGPCIAWYIVGSREVARQAVELEAAPLRVAQQTASQLAARLTARLESLRETESRRPFYHYQNLYHDPKGAYEGASVVPSPLAQGPADPLIRAYFQIDPAGRLSLPTLDEQPLEPTAPEELAAQRAIQQELQPAVPTSKCVASLQQPQQPALAGALQRVEVLDPAAWAQNIQAARLYADIKRSGKISPEQLEQPAGSKGNVQIRIGDFQWCTTPIENLPSLVALRNVITPQGVIVQGFLISSTALAESLNGAALPASIEPDTDTRTDDCGASLGTIGWRVSVDPSASIREARTRADAVRTRFLRSFIIGTVVAALAGLCIVGLVWQTERLARQRSQFAASAAHELRTPLAGLRMYSEMLAEGLGDPNRRTDYAHRVADEAERLGRVVSNVLEFTRLERGTLSVHPAMGDLAAAVRETVARQQPAIEAAGARVELSAPDQLPAVRFDPDAVAHIVQNLLDNAEKHTRSAPDRTIKVSLAADHAGVTLAVSDHGPGIPKRIRRRLFRPFARAGNSDAPPGLGLGLLLVKALARAQGGKVSYADAPGGGATFTVTLPI
jgi:signal transduction histidine kinase